MNLLFVFLQAGGGGDYSFLIMMVAIFAIMYFFMIRPQNKKQKEIANFRKNLEGWSGSDHCRWYIRKDKRNRR